MGRLRISGIVPQSKSSAERISVVTGAAVWRHFFQFLDVASSKNDVVGFEGGNQARHDSRHIPTPLLLPVLFERQEAHVALIRSLLVREMAQFHGLHYAIHNQTRTETCTQAQKEHFATLVAPQSLHGCIIDDLYGTPECTLKVKTDPTARQVMRFRNGPVLEHRPGISN